VTSQLWRQATDYSELAASGEPVRRQFLFWDHIYAVTDRRTLRYTFPSADEAPRLEEYVHLGAESKIVIETLFRVSDTLNGGLYGLSGSAEIIECGLSVLEGLGRIDKCRRNVSDALDDIYAGWNPQVQFPKGPARRVAPAVDNVEGLFITVLNESYRIVGAVYGILNILGHRTKKDYSSLNDVRHRVMEKFGGLIPIAFSCVDFEAMASVIGGARNAIEHPQSGNRLTVKNVSATRGGELVAPVWRAEYRHEVIVDGDDVLGTIEFLEECLLKMFVDISDSVLLLKYGFRAEPTSQDQRLKEDGIYFAPVAPVI
jgi:hypothetical protein